MKSARKWRKKCEKREKVCQRRKNRLNWKRM